MNKIILSLAILCLAQAGYAKETSRPNVILLTLDGVRWEDFFHDPSQPFADLIYKLAPLGVLFGDQKLGSNFYVANQINVSLPAYQSILAGETQPCDGNDCGRIKVETLQERLRRELKLKKQDVATIASWDTIRFAAEHIEGRTFLNVAFDPLVDDHPDSELAKLNAEQGTDKLGGCRLDRFTYAHGMRYLKLHHPRFLFLSFDDSDAYGHANRWDDYLASLRMYNTWIKEILATLDGMGAYGKNTTLIVTTDHGRGPGERWTDHGPDLPEAHSAWFFAISPKSRTHSVPPTSSTHTHLDIRPTIEALMGLKPLSGESRGHVMSELVDQH